MGEPLVELATSSGPILLYRCSLCGAYWRESLRESHLVTEAQARTDFPGAFAL